VVVEVVGLRVVAMVVEVVGLRVVAMVVEVVGLRVAEALVFGLHFEIFFLLNDYFYWQT
jgi:hypothetical protein